VLANVSATELTEQRMKVLQTYVRELGGGLVVIGGPNSYGLGGYFKTPLEETLPVDMQIKDQRRIPKLLMVYVIDRSGSMEEIGPSGVTNLELAKEATRRSMEFLFPQDRAGVLSFDSNPQWLVPIQNVNDRIALENQVGTLRPGGGTDIKAAIDEITRTVPSDPSTLKHVILLTDGGADPTGIVDEVRDMNQKNGITVTSIGIGQQVPSFMRDIATAGQGIYYELADLQTIPQVFAAETVLATRSYLVEKEFPPALSANSQIMQGISAVPSLLGYVATTPKDTATVILKSPEFGDPLLASWQYGLGRAVAWTSDATTRWSKHWTTWDDYARFWSQVIRSTITEGINNTLDSHVEVRNGQSVLVVDARDASGAFINGLNMEAAVVDPRLQAQTIPLKQIAPGQYEATFDPKNEGAYFIRIGGSGTSASGITTAVAQTTGWVFSYSPEYRLHDTNTNLLNDVIRLTGGSFVDTSRPELVFNHNITETHAAASLWPWLLLAVTILLPFDIGVRRVIVTRSDVKKGVAWVQERLGWLPRPQTLATSGRLTRLKNAKERASTNVPTPIAPVDTEAVRGFVRSRRENTTAQSAPSASQPSIQPTPPPVTPLQPPTPPEPRPAAPPKPPTPEPLPTDSGGSLASRLAERRRSRKDE
jgi:uncharacterized membrane protein